MAGLRDSVLQLFQPYKSDKRRNSTYFYFSFLPCLTPITEVPCKYSVINQTHTLPIRPILISETMTTADVTAKIASIHGLYAENYRVAYAENHVEGTALKTLFYKGEEVRYEHFHLVYNGRLYVMPSNAIN